MSTVVISGDTSGSITLQAPAVSGTTTLTLPAATGTVMVSGNMPAFSAYLASPQTPSNATYTKVQIDTELFDTASCFDTSTYRFTPNVAGYYQIQAACRISGTAPSGAVWAIYKNGTNVAELNIASSPATYDNRVVSTLVSMNGTSDYVEFYCYINASSSQTFNAGAPATYFQGFLVRLA